MAGPEFGAKILLAGANARDPPTLFYTAPAQCLRAQCGLRAMTAEFATLGSARIATCSLAIVMASLGAGELNEKVGRCDI